MPDGCALIIDDRKINIEVLQMLLDQEGMASIAVETPRLLNSTLVQGRDIRLVFLDLEMHNYSGLVMIKELRLYPELANALFIAYTAHTSEMAKARIAGFDHFLGKPLNVQKFSSQLARILNGEPVWEY